MATFAALKRRIQVGTVIAAQPGHPWAESVGIARTVRIVQTNAIAADKLDGLGVSWLYWPKASDVTYDDETLTFVVDGMPYQIVADSHIVPESASKVTAS